MTLELIASKVLKLSRLERIELALLIMDSIAIEEKANSSAKDKESELTAAQAKEIDRRMKLFKAGKMKTIPADTVKANLIEKYDLQT